MIDFIQDDGNKELWQEQENIAGMPDIQDVKDETADNNASQSDTTADSEGKQPEAAADSADINENAISELSDRMDALTELFKSKIETDEYKNHLFDEMHKQLAKYQDDALKSVIEPFISELITLLDNVKQYEKYTPEEATPENYAKLRKRMADVRGDIEDLLEEMDVSRYETDEIIPDTKRQKIIKTVRTEDASLNNTIAAKLSDGYIYRNKIIKYEKVSVYKAE